ncbi:MAG: type II toxin-antitoxin system Phd/YefM family antitoxin [Deltaproteobacteria bacterium CG_4_10_14_3_um_filter_60_8]|nr:MAG: type II toxin-antitoxin system Phd/YefM family antitoxin [Deltaproteobacteria bacterium CG_4_10_14_3_um_filter_60_8]
MAVSTSQLRGNIYKLLDKVLETGEPLEIERKGRKLKIIPSPAPDRFSRLQPHKKYLAADPEEIVHVDWSGEWRP